MRNIDGSRRKSYKNFKYDGKDSQFLLLVTRYFNSVQDDMKSILQSDKGMSRKEADEFMDKLFEIDYKRMLALKRDVANYYSDGYTTRECAKFILDKYYDIVRVNKYKTPYDKDEVTSDSITEAVKAKYRHNSLVSQSLFWSFLKKISNADATFVFDTTRIGDGYNTLNCEDPHCVFHMKTNTVRPNIAADEFMYSNETFSEVGNILSKKRYDSMVYFYIKDDDVSNMEFGYVIEDVGYKIGSFHYASIDMCRLFRLSTFTDSDIDPAILCRGIKTAFYEAKYTKNELLFRFRQYDGVDVYTDVRDSRLVVVVESSDADVVNSRYIKSSTDSFGKLSHTITTQKIGDKTEYVLSFS